MSKKPRRTKDQAIEMRDKCRDLRRQGLKIREVAESLGLHMSSAARYIYYCK